MKCPVGKKNAYGSEHYGGYERSCGRGYGSVVGQFGTADVHHPVEDEEQDGYDGRSPEASLVYERPQRRAYEKQYEAGERTGEFFQYFEFRPSYVIVAFRVFATYPFQIGDGIVGLFPCSFHGGCVVPGFFPLVFRELGRTYSPVEVRSVDLLVFQQMAVGEEGRHLDGVNLT